MSDGFKDEIYERAGMNAGFIIGYPEFETGFTESDRAPSLGGCVDVRGVEGAMEDLWGKTENTRDEWGVVVDAGAEYEVGEPFQGDRDELDISGRLSQGGGEVWLVHTHPPGGFQYAFSGADVLAHVTNSRDYHPSYQRTLSITELPSGGLAAFGLVNKSDANRSDFDDAIIPVESATRDIVMGTREGDFERFRSGLVAAWGAVEEVSLACRVRL
jgi:hypothetical protein